MKSTKTDKSSLLGEAYKELVDILRAFRRQLLTLADTLRSTEGLVALVIVLVFGAIASFLVLRGETIHLTECLAYRMSSPATFFLLLLTLIFNIAVLFAFGELLTYSTLRRKKARPISYQPHLRMFFIDLGVTFGAGLVSVILYMNAC
jgi:small-conductance mechanosensitive channel